MSTVEQRAQWRSLVEKSSVGPWLFSERYLRFDTAQLANDKTAYDDISWQALDVGLPELGKDSEPDTQRALADGRFICAARDAVPALLDDVEQLKKALNEALNLADETAEFGSQREARIAELRKLAQP